MNRLRLLVLALFLFASLSAVAQEPDRDVLLTQEGVLYTIESVFAEHAGVEAKATRLLQLTIGADDEQQSVTVPGSMIAGMHTNPALAWDRESKSLFVVWQNSTNNGLTSDLLFSSFKGGKWSQPTLISNAGFEYRQNLRIATTRYTLIDSSDASQERKPALVLHLVWWAQTGHGEKAGYAMLLLEDGAVKSVRTADLVELLGVARRSDEIVELPEDYDRDLFRHPAIFEKSAHDEVEIVFADSLTNRFHRIGVQPVKSANGVLRPPDGVWGGSIPPPQAFRRNTASEINVISGSPAGRLVFHFRSENGVKYMTYGDGEWSELRSVATSESFSPEAAVEVLRRMATSD